MWKRVVIGVLAVIVASVLAYMISQPRKGSIEWHKREYTEAKNYFLKDPTVARLKRIYWKVTGKPPPTPTVDSAEMDKQFARMESNRLALIRAQYLIERRFFLTNRSADYVTFKLYDLSNFRSGYAQVISSTEGESGPHQIGVSACPKDLPLIEAAIRKADVPKSGE